jgi:hypothetical protein
MVSDFSPLPQVAKSECYDSHFHHLHALQAAASFPCLTAPWNNMSQSKMIGSTKLF